MQWRVYYRTEPWGDDWQQFGLLISTIVNQTSNEPVYPCDIIPFGNEEGSGREQFLRSRKKQVEAIRAREVKIKEGLKK